MLEWLEVRIDVGDDKGLMYQYGTEPLNSDGDALIIIIIVVVIIVVVVVVISFVMRHWSTSRWRSSNAWIVLLYLYRIVKSGNTR